MSLEQTAERLYALAPEDFTAARDEAARQAKGDRDLVKQVKALRRPSVGAWLVNLLARRQPDLLEQLLALGPALAQAQGRGQGDALRALGAQRRELVGAVVSRAVEVSGRDVTATQRDEVAATLEAALADPASADVVRSGRLVRTLAYAGFGGVDLEGAVGGPGAAPATPSGTDERARTTGNADRQERTAAAEATALEAAGRLDDSVRACERRQQEQATARERAEQAHREVERRQQALHEAQEAAAEADRERLAAERASEQAVNAVRGAQRVEEEARAALDRLRRG